MQRFPRIPVLVFIAKILVALGVLLSAAPSVHAAPSAAAIEKKLRADQRKLLKACNKNQRSRRCRSLLKLLAQSATAVSFTYTPSSNLIAPVTVRFDGSSTVLPGGATQVRYRWDFGDGTSASGSIANKLFSTSGQRTVTLSVSYRLSGRFTATMRQVLTVGSGAPTPLSTSTPTATATSTSTPVSIDPSTPTPTSTPTSTSTPTPTPTPTSTSTVGVGVPVLIPGSGFSGPTAQPPVQGIASELGYDAKAIARWDVVPFQTLTSDLNVGVMAFHISGINRVDFSLNGGPWVASRQRAMNIETGANEYFVRVPVTQLADGPFEIRAVVYPNVGIPRVLGGAINPTSLRSGEHSVTLVANSRGTLPMRVKHVAINGSDLTGDGSASRPYRTILFAAKRIEAEQGGNAGGGKIYLHEGDHPFGNYQFSLYTIARGRYLEIEPLPGLAPHQVRLLRDPATTVGLGAEYIRIKNLTVSTAAGDSPILGANWDPDYLWADGVTFIGRGRTVSESFIGGFDGVYITNSSASDSSDGFVGTIVRNSAVTRIASDAFSESLLVINSTASDVDHRGTEYHPDVVQVFGNDTNLIYVGVVAADRIYGQGAFLAANSGSMTGIALVDCVFDNLSIAGGGSTGNYGYAFQVVGSAQHVYISNSRFLGVAGFRMDFPGFSLRNFVIENSSFPSYSSNMPNPDAPGQIRSGAIYR